MLECLRRWSFLRIPEGEIKAEEGNLGRNRNWKETNGRNGRINDSIQFHTVFIIKWCLAHQPKCSLFDIIVSSLTYAKLTIAQYELSSGDVNITPMSLSILCK